MHGFKDHLGWGPYARAVACSSAILGRQTLISPGKIGPMLVGKKQCGIRANLKQTRLAKLPNAPPIASLSMVRAPVHRGFNL